MNYPGLESSPYHDVATRIFGERCGALVTFELASKKECFAFLNKLKLLRRATNINDNKTLALHPASTIFCEYPADLKRQMGVPETLIRLSVGIEDVEDLHADIDTGPGGLMPLSDEQLERFSRHIILKDVGIEGQERILQGKVLIVGAGGLERRPRFTWPPRASARSASWMATWWTGPTCSGR